MENNWTIAQTKQLFATVAQAGKNGHGLVWAFEAVAKECGRSSNSVRNYYYSQLKMFHLLPSLAADLGIELSGSKREEFELFSQQQIRELLEGVLIGKAMGKSVRAIIAEMSDGDAKCALRLQNKYRSMLAHHRAYVEEVMRDLAARGVTYYDPYRKSVGDGGDDNLKKLTEYVSKLDDQEAGSFLRLIKKLT